MPNSPKTPKFRNDRNNRKTEARQSQQTGLLTKNTRPRQNPLFPAKKCNGSCIFWCGGSEFTILPCGGGCLR